MLKNTTTYRLNEAHSPFHRLLMWGHNYCAFLGKEVVVLAPTDGNGYKISHQENKTWTKVQFVAHLILACTIVIPTIAFLFKLGARHWIHIGESNSSLPPAHAALPPSPAPNPFHVPTVSLSPEQQQDLRFTLWGEGILHTLSQLTLEKQVAWFCSDNEENINEKIDFISTYEAAQSIWNSNDCAIGMTNDDQTIWSSLTEIYKRLKPNPKQFTQFFGPASPFGSVVAKFNFSTCTVDWTNEEAIQFFEKNSQSLALFREIEGKRFSVASSFASMTNEEILWHTPHVMVITGFAFRLKNIIQFAPSLIWTGALNVVPEQQCTKQYLQEIADAVADCRTFLEEEYKARQAMEMADEVFKASHKQKWDNTQNIAKKVRDRFFTSIQIKITSLPTTSSEEYAKSLTASTYAELKDLYAVLRLIPANKLGTPAKNTAESLYEKARQARTFINEVMNAYQKLHPTPS